MNLSFTVFFCYGLIFVLLYLIINLAHPTEVNRRTRIRIHQRVELILEQLDRPDLLAYERETLEKSLETEILSIWNSDDIVRKKPTPIDEARGGLAIVENVLWNAVPRYIRKLDYALQAELGKGLPLSITPIQISSWMGGDRDGNPNVTPPITLEVL